MERPNELREICQAGKMSEPAWYTVHRRLSIYVTWACLHTPMTPNHATFLMMATAAAGALLLASDQLSVNLVGFALLYVSFLFDKVDGEMARYYGVCSPRAILLDRFHHLAIEPAILFAAGWRAFQGSGNVAVLIAAMAAIAVGNIIEEQTHLAPYALTKHLREVGEFPRTEGRATRSLVDRLYPIFRSFKVFRMFIAVVPSLLLGYVGEAVFGAPIVAAYLFVAVTALSIYLAFQTAWYFDIKLEGEIAAMRGFVRTGSMRVAGNAREKSTDAVVVLPVIHRDRAGDEGRTNGPRTVSGAKRHDPSRVVRDLTQ
jgi:hypothetical protein